MASKKRKKKDKTKSGTHEKKTDLVPLIQSKLLCQADVSVDMDDGQRHVADDLVRKKDHRNGADNDDDDNDEDDADSDDGRPPTAIST